MTRHATNSRLGLPIAWIAILALVLAPGLSEFRFEACLGGPCCVTEGMAFESFESEPADDEEDGCTCCREDDGDEGRAPTPPEPRFPEPSCDPDCCIVIDFDVEFGPVVEPEPRDVATRADPTTAQPAAMPPFAVTVPSPRRIRPPERAPPPRLDRRTALRACTVLLI